VAEAIEMASAFTPDWERLTCDEFLKLFEQRASPRRQTVPPSLGG